MKRNKNQLINFEQINAKLIGYTHSGYDLHFLHGWFTAYLSAPNDSEDDLLIPDYLIIKEESITNEQEFSSFIDKLVEVYSTLAEALFENNKQIYPVVDLSNVTFFEVKAFTHVHLSNLLKWLYGYLAGFMVIGVDVSDFNDEDLLAERFYPALFTLCIAFFYLDKTVVHQNVSEAFSLDYKELIVDLKEMWESQDGEEDIESMISTMIDKLDLNDILIAVNDIFYVVRRYDELKSSQQSANPLLEKLMSKH